MSNKQEKKWEYLPKIEDKYFEVFPEYNKVVLQLLYNRGIQEKKDIETFLFGTYEKDANDPYIFSYMEEAVELVIKHIKSQNKICVYGDYDADGVTSAALLKNVLDTLKADVMVYLPDRVSEGYGLNKNAVQYIIDEGAQLIITADCGMRSREEVEFAESKGIEVLITDHHPPSETQEDMPRCLVVNPVGPDEAYPFKKLAGVAVAFKLALALIKKSKISEEDKKKLEEKVLDLVAIGTVADCVPLNGENRLLLKKGLEVLNKSKREGIVELKKIAGIKEQELKSWNIGFQIGPRLNAAGRLDHANSAYELLVAKDKKEVEKLAQGLNARNEERQRITEDIAKQMEEYANEAVENGDKIIVGVSKDDIWNEGVVGLVAGRICEKYYLPTLVITKVEEGYKGSGRSIDEFNLAKAVEQTKDILDKYGGHPKACGLSMPHDSIEEFSKRIKEIANEKLKDVKLAPTVRIASDLKLIDINEDLYNSINKLEPFGQENENPIFASQGVRVMDILNMGMDGQHIKLRLKQDNSNVISALGFNQSEKWQALTIGDEIDIAYYLDVNEFNGRREIQMKIVDIKYRD